MLTKADIELVKKTRKEIAANRTVPVVLYRKVPALFDPLTGDMIYDITEEQVEALWRHYISKSPGTDDIRYVGGVVAEIGDAFVEFELTVDLSNVETIKNVETGELWRIRGVDKIGLGEPNRYYVLLGKVH